MLDEQLDNSRVIRENVYGPRLDLGLHTNMEILNRKWRELKLAKVRTSVNAKTPPECPFGIEASRGFSREGPSRAAFPDCRDSSTSKSSECLLIGSPTHTPDPKLPLASSKSSIKNLLLVLPPSIALSNYATNSFTSISVSPSRQNLESTRIPLTLRKRCHRLFHPYLQPAADVDFFSCHKTRQT